MQKIKLTQELVKKLKAGVKPYDVRDSVLQSFGVRVYPSGRKTYFIQAQSRRRRTWEALGSTNELTTAYARKMAFGTYIKSPKLELMSSLGEAKYPPNRITQNTQKSRLLWSPYEPAR